MINYNDELYEQLNGLRLLRTKVEERIKNSKDAKAGSLRITSCHGYPQYYFREKGSAKEQYMPVTEKKMIKELAQYEYDIKILKEIISLEKKLSKHLNSYDISVIDNSYEKLCKARKDLVEPIKPTISMKINAWYEQNEGRQNPFEMKTPFQTEKGELVRSKSEKILADYFDSRKIPYAYEPKFILYDGRAVYPDFALYAVSSDYTVYWEHLGLADDMEYAFRNNKKIIAYEKSGLVVGKTLIISYESVDSPLDMKVIKEKTKALL